jgi:transposase
MLCRRFERELTASNERVRLLISERDTARGYANQKWKLRQEFHDLFGTDDVAEAVALVRGLQQRIKRLEEALEGSLKWIVDLANSGDIGFYNIEEDSEIIAARAALRAKEAKP